MKQFTTDKEQIIGNYNPDLCQIQQVFTGTNRPNERNKARKSEDIFVNIKSYLILEMCTSMLRFQSGLLLNGTKSLLINKGLKVYSYMNVIETFEINMISVITQCQPISTSLGQNNVIALDFLYRFCGLRNLV